MELLVRYRWGVTRFKLGAISQPHKLLLEMLLPNSNSSIGIDNIRLIDCFPGKYYFYDCNLKDLMRKIWKISITTIMKETWFLFQN